MPRSVPEWRGSTDNTPVPPRVKLRIFTNAIGCCSDCHRTIVGRLLPRYDHIIALINSGENRESNIQLLCNECHDQKSKSDVREKSALYNKKIKRLGFKNRRKIPGSRGSGIRRTMRGKVWKE